MRTCKGRGSGLFYLWEESSRWEKIFERGTNPVLRGGRIGGSGGVGREEREDTAAEFFGIKTVSGGVEGARNDPKLFGAAGGGVDHLRVAARQGDILFIANEEKGESAGRRAVFRGKFREPESREVVVAC